MTKIDNKNNLNNLKFFIIHANKASLEPEDEHYGEDNYEKQILDKTIDEIMIATEQVPAILKAKNSRNYNNINIIEYFYQYLNAIFLDENNNVLLIKPINSYTQMQFNIDKNGYPYIIQEVPVG